MAKKKPAAPKVAKPANTRAGRNRGGKVNIKQAQFLAAYSQTGNITVAAQMANVNRHMHYTWLEKDPAYRPKFETAHEEAVDTLEKEARRRAVEGVEEPVFGSGGRGFGTVQVGSVRKYSDTLLIFLLKGVRPEKYRDNHRVQVEGQVNHTGNVQIYIPDNSRD